MVLRKPLPGLVVELRKVGVTRNPCFPFLPSPLTRRKLFSLLKGGDKGQVGGLFGQHPKEGRKFYMMAKKDVREGTGKWPTHTHF